MSRAVRRIGRALYIGLGVGLGLGLAPSTAATGSRYGHVYIFQDWVLACDNTHRCEAAGYQPDSASRAPAALLLSREAGPHTPVEIKLTFADNLAGTALRLTVDKFQLAEVVADKPLSADQAARLLPWLIKGRELRLSAGSRSWTVSLAGAAATLLRMDQLQGRVNTPGAAVRKGTQPESSVPRAQPVPLVRTLPLPSEREHDADLIAPILASIKDADFCADPAFGRAHAAQAQVTRLSAHQVLIVSSCWQGAYQDGSGAWIANDQPPYQATKVRFPMPDGSTEDEPTFLDIDPNGHAYSSHKGRGIGDCIFTAEWGWTGQGFSLVNASDAGLCKGFAGGIALRLWVAHEPSQAASR